MNLGKFKKDYDWGNIKVNLVYSYLFSGCYYVSKIEENKNEDCELITKKMTIGKRGEFPEECNDECLLIALTGATTSYIVSGSIVAVSNTVHWIEKQGRCEDSFIREKINKFYKKTFSLGGYILKTSENFGNWFKGNVETSSSDKE